LTGPVVLGIVSAAVAAVFLLLAGRALARRRLLDAVPTSKVAGVFLGLTEVKGEAETPRPLTSFLAEVACVYFRYSVEEQWERTETETYTDSDGHTRTRTRTVSGWTTVASGGKTPPFFLRDDTGAIRIVPDRGDVEAATVFSRTCHRGDPLYYGRGPAGSISNSTHRRSFTEHALPIGASLYVLGTARLRKDGITPEIGWSRDDRTLLISIRPEEKIARGLGWIFGILFFVGALFAAMAGAAFARTGLEQGFVDFLRLHGDRILGAVAIYAGAIAVWFLVLVHNGLVYLRHRVANAWSQVEIQLQRRFDLIPRLAEVVRGYAAHERDLFERIARLRAPADSARAEPRAAARKLPSRAAARETQAAAEDQTRALRGLLGIVEGYPALRADEQFRALMRRLSKTEDRIALARAFFNESATVYNRRIESFPDLLVARLVGCRRRPLLGFGDAREVTKVALRRSKSEKA